jgi:hypothetical protein
MTKGTTFGDAFCAGIGFGLGLTMLNLTLQRVAPPERVRQVIICQMCGYRNADGNRFCSECGRPILPQPSVTCPNCGAVVAARKFCGLCGALMQEQKKKG